MIILQDVLYFLVIAVKYAFFFWYLYRQNRLSPLPLRSLTEVLLIESGLCLAFIVTEITTKPFFSSLFFYYLIGVALKEELLKYLAGFLYMRKNGRPISKYNAVLLFATSALTFSLTEDIEYIITSDNALSTALIRFLKPSHVVYGIEMGFFSGLAWEKAQQGENRKSVLFRIASIAVPTLHHFLWNWVDGILVFCLGIIGYFIIFIWSRKLAKNDSFIVPPEEEQTC